MSSDQQSGHAKWVNFLHIRITLEYGVYGGLFWGSPPSQYISLVMVLFSFLLNFTLTGPWPL